MNYQPRRGGRAADPHTRRVELGPLFRALDDAAAVLRLPDGVVSTARLLIRSIPKGAPWPISPLSVANAASERNVTTRTIRNHVEILEKHGLVRDTTTGRGRRIVRRNGRREIVEIAGVDFGPLEQDKDAWTQRKRVRAEEQRQRGTIRSSISRMRKEISRFIDGPEIAEEHRRLWKSLPRRIADFDLTQLRELEDTVSNLHRKVLASRNDASDRSEKKDRPYTALKEESLFSAMLAEKGENAESEALRSPGGLESITLGLLEESLPDDWIAGIEQYGEVNWRAFIDFAYQRAREIGVKDGAWALAQRDLGHAGAAVLVLVADASSQERGGQIHNPGGWIRRMASRVVDGRVDLYAKVLDLAERKQ